MLNIAITLVLLVAAVVAHFAHKADKQFPSFIRWVSGALALAFFMFSCFTQVSQSSAGIVTTFGKVQPEILTEGAHFVLPWSKVHEVYLGQQKVEVKSEAASRDMQSVDAKLAVLYVVAKPRELFVQNPTQSYPQLIVEPAVTEAFKAVVSQYTAEELITKRSEVSANISKIIDTKLDSHYLRTQTVNVVNFDFSKAFNAAIEEKVTVSQKAEAAKRNLDRIEYEAKARIAQAEGEAKAITIQAAAVEKAGGAAYIQLQAIERWDGKLPTTMAGGAVPFLNVK